MTEIGKALIKAFASLLHPRMLLLMLWPLLPLLGFFAPVYGGLAFIHYCLARLAQLRAEPGATQ